MLLILHTGSSAGSKTFNTSGASEKAFICAGAEMAIQVEKTYNENGRRMVGKETK